MLLAIKKYRILLNIIILIALLVYSVKSILYIYHWFHKTNNLDIEYSILFEQNKQMSAEIQNLQLKVNGLTEPNINKELLETQAKIHLNLSKENEFVIVN
ncbi:hypothetical protein HPDP_00292 [Candidatus Hepatincola sp. Pdp]